MRKFFLDGTPVPDDYLDHVSAAFKEALEAVENMTPEELDEFERENIISTQGGSGHGKLH